MNELLLSEVIGPHQDTKVLVRGNTKNPTHALILMHGRGASAEHFLEVIKPIAIPQHLVVYALNAGGQSWFPSPFNNPRSQNEPHLSSALLALGSVIARAQNDFGIMQTNVTMAGFSQGASLVAEYLATHPAQYNGACIYSGGLFGERIDVDNIDPTGNLLDTPVYMGCDIEDPYVPLVRFQITRDVLNKLGARLIYREYEDLRHSIHPEGLDFLGQLMYSH